MNSLISAETAPLLLPSYWYIIMAALSLMLPAGFVLVSAAGLGPRRAWDAAMGALAASGISVFMYWAVGFGLQFGGVGLVYGQPDLQPLVWEWSALSSDWGSGWGMAGLSGWFLSGIEVTPIMYALFLAHLPWVMTASMIPVIALRGRAPATATILIAIIVGGFIYPLAGNWVQGGGWLSALGRNLTLGHGLIDYGGTGTVFLVASAFSLPALLLWVPRQTSRESVLVDLPASHLPLLCIAGSLMVMIGAVGWLGSNPLQVTVLDELALLRGNVALILCAGGGVLVPVIYTWFVTGQSDPLMSGRGFVAGAIAGLAAAPFIQPGSAFLLGAAVGALFPFVTYMTNQLLKLDDATGIVHMCLIPASLGLLFAGLFADGISGAGWQLTGMDSYLGVTGQGVSGLMTASGFQPDFPAQLQAQVVGLLSLGLWGFVSGLAICTPLALLYRAVESIPGFPASAPENVNMVPGFSSVEYAEQQYAESQYPKEQYAEGQYAEGAYPSGQYTANQYSTEQESPAESYLQESHPKESYPDDYAEDDFGYSPSIADSDPNSTQAQPPFTEQREVQPRFTALTRRRPPTDPA